MRRFLVTALALAAGLFGPPAIAMHIDFTDRAFWADGTLSKMIAPDIEAARAVVRGPLAVAAGLAPLALGGAA